MQKVNSDEYVISIPLQAGEKSHLSTPLRFKDFSLHFESKLACVFGRVTCLRPGQKIEMQYCLSSGMII